MAALSSCLLSSRRACVICVGTGSSTRRLARFLTSAGTHPPRVSRPYGAPGSTQERRYSVGRRLAFSIPALHYRPPDPPDTSMKRFADLSEQEILALAITNEEEDSRIYRGFADGLREQYPSSAQMFEEMAQEEVKHRGMLFDLYRLKFGEYMPLIRRQDVK